VIYRFRGGDDGFDPSGRVVFGPDGALYGVTSAGGSSNCYGAGCGTVYRLTPAASVCANALCSWREEVIYRFNGGQNDGANPSGDLTFDRAGNVYGTTVYGATYGTVYELTRSGNNWTETVLHTFGFNLDGSGPSSGVVFDPVGNVYGTTAWGGINGHGTVYEMTPSSSGWNEQVLYNFGSSILNTPVGSPTLDAVGNLYGSTAWGGAGLGGGVFELMQAYGGWSFSLLYNGSSWAGGPFADLTWDAAGNLYGTSRGGNGRAYGSIFRLVGSSGGWGYQALYNFDGGSQGGLPESNVTVDVNGNLYGTTFAGGCGACTGYPDNGCGVVWKLTL